MQPWLGHPPEQGLDEAAARARLAAEGPNELPQTSAPSALRLLARQLSSSMVVLLAGAAAVSVAIGELVDAAVIAAIVALDAVLGYVQERRADDAARAVRELLTPSAVVVRGGRRRLVDATEVVVGDVLGIDPASASPRTGACSPRALSRSTSPC